MSKNMSILLNSFVALAMILALVAVPLSAVAQDDVPADPNRRINRDAGELKAFSEMAKAPPIDKFHPALREKALAGGTEDVSIYVAIQGEADMGNYMDRVITRPAVFGGIRNVYGTTTTNNLMKIAQLPFVIAVVPVGEPTEKPYDPEIDNTPTDLATRWAELQAGELTYAEALAASPEVEPQGWFDVLDGHQSSDAWTKGFTGDGVIVGILDDGVDFAHPDLQGTYAWVTDVGSPYYGWPMAFSQVSTLYFAQEVLFQDLGARGITQNWGGSHWSDTQYTIEASTPFGDGTVTGWYQPIGSGVSYEYTIPATSASGFYKLGSHPDRTLNNLYGHRVAILVADEHVPGVYDTVYVDLDNDKDFTDEKPVTQSSPEVYRDMDGDGYADVSGGLLVWISDGDNLPPTVDYLWGLTCGDEVGTLKACPDSGELLIFAGYLEAGSQSSHGTLCASNVAAQGVIAGGMSAQPFAVGGMLRGSAPDVGIMDFGNHYYLGTDEDEFLVAALGYDGIPNSGDEVQITSNSYGNFRQMWGSWGYIGRLITALNTTIAPTTVWMFSSGNEGPGYGPQEGDSSPTTVQVGSSTQYGSTNWDSIANASQIMYGDPNSFFAKGPNRDGSSGLDVLANGGRGSGAVNLNFIFDGWEAFETWGGTSRSAPAAAGNMALVYQAYKDRYGEWPTWEMAKTLIKNGATNSISSPFYQGAGVVNADRATNLAAGIYGVYAIPHEWQVGDWQGADYLNFANVAWPGETYSMTYTVYNPSGYDVNVNLSDGVMTKIGGYETSFTTSDESLESSFNFHSPDYLLQMDDSLIPSDAELMVVRYVHPYDTFDPDFAFDGNPNSSWRFLLYNWTDLNGDGMLWQDTNGNGVVNHVDDVAAGMDNDGFYRPDFDDPGTEIQEGEYVRVDYEFGGLAVNIMVNDPLERIADGYFFGFQHRNNDGSVPQTTVQIGVEFYKRADVPWLSLNTGYLLVPAEGMATFDAQVTVPTDVHPGAHEAVIYMTDTGNYSYEGHETALPVVLNVISDLPDDGAFTLGGQPRANTLYDNSNTYGYFNWYGGGWTGAGDWRHYFFEVDEDDLENDNLLIHTSWDTGYPTDFNTWVLGPTYDCASNAVGPCAWFEPGLGQPNPAVFGPYTLQPIGASEPFQTGANYPFNTSTGGPDDWLKVPLGMDGLHAIALHNVLFEGESLTTGMHVDVGTILMGVEVDPEVGTGTVGSIYAEVYTDTGEIDVTFTPTLEMPDLIASLTGGLATDNFGPFTSNVPDAGGTYDAWDPNNVYEPIMVDQVGATELGIHLHTPDGQDPDMFLIYDSNDNGVPDQGIDPVVGSSGNATGSDEEIVLASPALGRYFVVLHGYDVDPDSGVDMDWEYWVTYPGDLSADLTEWFSDTVTINQDDVFDPTTSSFSMTVTTSERTQNLYFNLSGIPAGNDVDLYLSDDSGIIAQSQERGNDDEHITWSPDLGEYRLGEGEEFTIWVHGFEVPAGPIDPVLEVWSDELNLWLSATHPDVHVSEIGAGETVSMTVHFAKEGWEPGDADLSARLLVGSSVMEDMFDELLVIERTDAPPPEGWNPGNLSISITADSERGESPTSVWLVGGAPISTALVAAGEIVTYTVSVENLDSFDSPNLYVDAWPLPADYLCVYFSECTNQVFGVDYGLISGSSGTFDYGSGIEWSGIIPSGNSIEFSYWVEMPGDMVPGQNHTSGVDVYVGTSFLDPWIGWGLAGGYDRAFVYGFDGYKMSNPSWAAPGDTFSYEITLMNQSAEDLEVMLSDPLPPEVTFVSATPGMNYDAGTHTVTWEGLLPGAADSFMDFEIVVTANAGLPEGTMLWNIATVFGKYHGDQIAALTATTVIDDWMDPYVTVEKTVDRLIGQVGTELTFTIVVSNYGDEVASDVYVMDVIPDELDYVAGSLTGGATHTDGVIEWTGDLGAGASHTITFKATINSTAHIGLAIINAAESMADSPFVRMMDFNSSVTMVTSLVDIYLPIIGK
jgi:uncharacterized repeat protein (TIGR01451 family)